MLTLRSNGQTMKKRIRSISIKLITLSALALTACSDPLQITESGSTPGSDVALDAPSPTSQLALEARIVGGTSVTSNKYPWMAAISQRGISGTAGQFCGGTLVADKWVLTAAHCLKQSRANTLSVLLGQISLNGSGGDRFNVSRIIEHPGYRTRGYPDLALLELSRTSSAKPIQLPTRSNPVAAPGERATVIGWGQLSENRRGNVSQLREAEMPIVRHQTCRAAYSGDVGIVEDAMICAGTPSGDKDSCYGDSGGPLFVSSGQEYVQAGVVSFGKECGLANVPGVYARVASYHDWISAYANVSTYNGRPTSNSNPTNNPTNNPSNNPTQPQEATIEISCTGLSCSMSVNNLGTGNYYWDVGSGYRNLGRNIRHVYNSAGDYTVNLLFVAQSGVFRQLSKQVRVTSLQNENISNTVVLPQFTGRLQGRGSYVNLPGNGVPISLPAGNLNANLKVPATQLFALILFRYDAAANTWIRASSALSSSGSAAMSTPVEAGKYIFIVQLWSDGGNFTLNARVN